MKQDYVAVAPAEIIAGPALLTPTAEIDLSTEPAMENDQPPSTPARPPRWNHDHDELSEASPEAIMYYETEGMRLLSDFFNKEPPGNRMQTFCIKFEGTPFICVVSEKPLTNPLPPTAIPTKRLNGTICFDALDAYLRSKGKQGLPDPEKTATPQARTHAIDMGNPKERQEKLRPGASIGPKGRDWFGSLGIWLADKESPKDIYMLTCAHNFAIATATDSMSKLEALRCNQSLGEGHAVYQPASFTTKGKILDARESIEGSIYSLEDEEKNLEKRLEKLGGTWKAMNLALAAQGKPTIVNSKGPSGNDPEDVEPLSEAIMDMLEIPINRLQDVLSTIQEAEQTILEHEKEMSEDSACIGHLTEMYELMAFPNRDMYFDYCLIKLRKPEGFTRIPKNMVAGSRIRGVKDFSVFDTDDEFCKAGAASGMKKGKFLKDVKSSFHGHPRFPKCTFVSKVLIPKVNKGTADYILTFRGDSGGPIFHKPSSCIIGYTLGYTHITMDETTKTAVSIVVTIAAEVSNVLKRINEKYGKDLEVV